MHVVSRRGNYVELPGDVYIGRPTRWGNPYTIGKDGTRKDVLNKYRTWIASHAHLVESLRDLQPVRLVCWCAPLECHGDVLLELLEGNGEPS